MKLSFFFLILLLSLPAMSAKGIYFEGEIDEFSLLNLEKKIVKEAGRFKPGQERIIRIDLNSGGGNLLKTFSSVKRIRSFEQTLNVKIHTRISGDCESSCTVLFTAGSVRHARKRSSFGFHSPAIASRIPEGMSKTQIIEDARIRWISAISEVDSQLGAELQRRGLLLKSNMTYIRAKDLLNGYVTVID